MSVLKKLNPYELISIHVTFGNPSKIFPLWLFVVSTCLFTTWGSWSSPIEGRLKPLPYLSWVSAEWWFCFLECYASYAFWQPADSVSIRSWLHLYFVPRASASVLPGFQRRIWTMTPGNERPSLFNRSQGGRCIIVITNRPPFFFRGLKLKTEDPISSSPPKDNQFSDTKIFIRFSRERFFLREQLRAICGGVLFFSGVKSKAFSRLFQKKTSPNSTWAPCRKVRVTGFFLYFSLKSRPWIPKSLESDAHFSQPFGWEVNKLEDLQLKTLSSWWKQKAQKARNGSWKIQDEGETTSVETALCLPFFSSSFQNANGGRGMVGVAAWK